MWRALSGALLFLRGSLHLLAWVIQWKLAGIEDFR